jgi:hypothetical protein
MYQNLKMMCEFVSISIDEKNLCGLKALDKNKCHGNNF